MIILDRDREIVERARHRLVTAMVHMMTPEFLELFPEDRIHKAYELEEKPGDFVLSSAYFLSPDKSLILTQDTCNPEIAHNAELRRKINEKIKSRNHALVAGGLSSDEQRFLFDSADLTDEATGLPKGMTIVFNDMSPIADQVATLPFKGLQGKLMAVQERLAQEGGRLQAVRMRHSCAMSAADFNKIAMETYVQGFKPSDGERMLRKADRLLSDMGVPRIVPEKRTLN